MSTAGGPVRQGGFDEIGNYVRGVDRFGCFRSGRALLAQLRDNSEKQMACQNGSYDSDGVRHCEVREQTVAAIGRLSVDANRNGGVTVKGWLGNEVLVRARVEASAENEGAAANLASRVSIDGSGGQVRPPGPNRWTITIRGGASATKSSFRRIRT